MINQLNINKMKNLNFKTMRKLVLALLMLLTLSLSAQEKDVIKFMGIPVDGTKSQMISKLEEKGFVTVEGIRRIEDAEKELERLGGEVTGGKMRENDQDYFMDGYFDGKRCTIVLFSYKSIVYKISVFLEDSYKKKFDAFFRFNDYAEKLQKKYYDENNYYKPLDYSDELNLDADYFNMFIDKQKKGGVILHITYPQTNMEYHIFIEYLNIANMPNGEDL